MDAGYLRHSLTDDEREQFNEKGYLIVENALDEDRTAHLSALLDRLRAAGRLGEAGLNLGVRARLHRPDFLSIDQAFIDLLDHPATFPKVWAILGWNIYCYHTHLGISDPIDEPYDPNEPTYVWHQDSIPGGRDFPELEVPARLSLKIGFIISDASEPGRGNFWVIPGSHRRKEIELPVDGKGQPKGAIPICVPAGTAVFFDRRIWHAASPNYWTEPRKLLAYGYGYRWVRNKDEMTIPPDVMERSSPIRRQLLGHATSANSRYGQPEDTPLLSWLREHQPQYTYMGGPKDPN